MSQYWGRRATRVEQAFRDSYRVSVPKVKGLFERLTRAKRQAAARKQAWTVKAKMLARKVELAQAARQ